MVISTLEILPIAIVARTSSALANNDSYDIIVRNTGANVGSCNPIVRDFEVCTLAIFSCYVLPAYMCSTT